MKKIMSLILSCVMLLTLVVPITAETGEAAVTFVVTDTETGAILNPDSETGVVTVTVGQKVNVTLSLNNVKTDYSIVTLGLESRDTSEKYIASKWTQSDLQWVHSHPQGAMAPQVKENKTAFFVADKAVSWNTTIASIPFEAIKMTTEENTKIDFLVLLQNPGAEELRGSIPVKVLGADFAKTELQLGGTNVNATTAESTDAYTCDYNASGYAVGAKAFDEKNAEITGVTVKYSVKKDGSYPEPVEENLTLTELGTYDVKAVITKDGFNPVTLYKRITINPRSFGELSLEGDTNVVYDGKSHQPEIVGLSEADKAGAEINWVVTDKNNNKIETPDYTSVGTYNITAIVAKPGYTKAVTTPVFTLTITPATLTVTGFEAQDKTYDGTTNATISATDVGITGFVNEKTASLTGLAETFTGAFVSKDAGTNVAVTADTVASITNVVKAAATDDVFANYTFAPIAVEGADIAKRTITVTPEYTKKLISVEEDPVIAYTFEGTFVSGDEFTGALSRKPGNEVGKYAILNTLVVTPAVNAKNYDIILDTKTNDADESNDIFFEIIDKVYTKIEVTKNYTGTPEYIEGTPFDKNTITVTGFYKDEDGEEVKDPTPITGYTVDPAKFEYDENPVTVTVSLPIGGGNVLTATNETITVKVVKKSVKEINITDATTEYNEAAPYSDAMKVTVVYDNDDKQVLKKDEYTIDTTAVQVDGNGLLKPSGETGYAVVVKLNAEAGINNPNNVTGSYTIKVKARVLDSIAVTTLPTTLNYVETESDKFSTAGMVVTATYLNYEPVTAVLDLENVVVTKPDFTVGKCPVKVEYTENDVTKTASFDITVTAKAVKSIAVSGTPAKTEYIEGKVFDPKGLTIVVTYNDGTTASTGKLEDNITLSDFTYSPSPLTVGTTTVKVSYGGKEADVTGITVAAKKVKELVVTSVADQFVDGDTVSAEDITVKAIYDNGDSNTNFTGYTVDPVALKLPDAKVGETIKVTVSYTNAGETTSVTTTFDAKVVPCEAVNTTTGERYDSLEEALTEAQDGETVEVQLDTEITDDVEISADVTLDLNGKDVTTAEDKTINTGDNTLTVDNTDGAADVVLSINGEDVTIAAGETTEVTEAEEESNHDFEIMFTMARTYHENFVFDIVIEKAAHGTIKGRTLARINETPTFTITPDEGYEIADVIVDGESVGAVEKYKFDKVKDDHTITAVFEKID